MGPSANTEGLRMPQVLKISLLCANFMIIMTITNTQHLYGMQICADTVAGDAMLRGISGGQKKRLTTAEMVSSVRYLQYTDCLRCIRREMNFTKNATALG